MLYIIVQNQELAIVIAGCSYSSVGNILQRDIQIDHGEVSIWSWLDVLAQISARLMIHWPLYGNWVTITLEFGLHNIIIHYSNPMTIPLLPTLLTLELHNLSTDRSSEELKFKEIWLTWIKTHPIANPFVSQTNI